MEEMWRESLSNERASRESRTTILLVDDNAATRTFVRVTLEAFGYTIVEAVDADEALEKFREHRDAIGLLLLDVIMPKKNGGILYEEISRIEPDIKVLFMSGYTRDFIVKRGILDGDTYVLPKPFLPRDLLDRVRDSLGD